MITRANRAMTSQGIPPGVVAPSGNSYPVPEFSTIPLDPESRFRDDLTRNPPNAQRTGRKANSAHMDTPWRIQLFGGLRAECGERVVERFRTQKTGALLAFLAFHRDRSHPREVLIEVLWPASPPLAGRQSLSMAISSLRHQFEPPGVAAGSFVRTDRFSVQLNPGAVDTDVADFEKALSAAGVAPTDNERAHLLAQAADLYRGDLLPGFYQDWILTEQRRLADLYYRAVRRLTKHFEQTEQWERALDCARRAAALDPLREESQYELMRLLLLAGQPSAALRQFEEIERLLRDELNTAPSVAIRRLAEEIRSSLAKGAPVSAPSPTLEIPPSAAALPTGTVTFLLMEMERAAPIDPQESTSFDAAMGRLKGILREVLSAHGAHIVSESPGSATLAFERASVALACALECQRATAESAECEGAGALRIRMALDTTEVSHTVRKAGGTLLARATGLVLAAHGGQILCTEPTAALLRSGLPADCRLPDLGIYRLRGLEAPERLYAIEYPGMTPQQAPPLNAPLAYTSNLPLQLTRFFGRHEELNRLGDLLLNDDVRLVTLTGPGGSGKTRLAIEAARHLLDAFREAVWFVALQDLSDASHIPDAVVGALRLQRSPDAEPMAQIIEALSRQPSLLIFDNFEHLLDGGASLIRVLLEKVPTLKCLATSRRPLDLTGEREFPVPPLPTPADEQSPESVVRFSSVELFTDRAQLVRPDFQVTKSNARPVAELCRRLDGIPLALELAAARIQTLTPARMLEQLEHRFDFLISRKRDVVDRHKTLWASVEWSYKLLSPELQRFFARLSVFRGGWTVEAAQAVCEEPRAADYLAELRGCSMVLTAQATDQSGETRFRMLETLREYAAGQLSADETGVIRQNHAHFYLALGKEAAAQIGKPDQVPWLDRLEKEHDNLRAALEWCRSENGDAVVGLELAVALGRFWQARGYLTEGRGHLKAILALKGAGGRTKERAAALNNSGLLALDQGDFDDAEVVFEQAIAIRRELDDRSGIAGLLNNLANVVHSRGDYAKARSLYLEALTINREVGNRAWEANNLSNLGSIAFYQGNYDLAQTLYEQCLAIRRELGDKRLEATTIGNLGLVARFRGDLRHARALFLEALGLERAIGDRGLQALELLQLGGTAAEEGDHVKAREFLRDALMTAQELGRKTVIAGALDEVAGLCVRERRMEQATRFMGAEEALREALGYPQPPNVASEHEESVAEVQAALDEDTFAAAWSEGEGMTFEQAVAMALQELERP